MKTKIGTSEKSDVVLLGNQTPEGTQALRIKDGEASPCILSPVVEGRPIPENSELISVTPRAANPRICDVNPAYVGKKGPARVATKAYSDGYDKVFANSRGSSAKN